ncbi:gamma-glutamylcyclotransferase [Vibrio metschnikovii]|uniref:gamma-glutamylcyclotransferase family protein n=1 Tax=Vibrio metschnikovii TaxID=28172 RepID=UPI003318962A
MLRLQIWWLLFQYYDLKRRISGCDEKVWYFAYGANLDEEVLKLRGIEWDDVQTYHLRGYEISFDHPSPIYGVGYCTIDINISESVYGRLWRIRKYDLSFLDYDELAVIFNRYRRVKHVTEDGKVIYFYTSLVKKSNLLPSPQYLAMLKHGIAQAGDFPAYYVNKINRQKCCSSNIKSIDSSYFINNIPSYPFGIRSLLFVYEKLCIRMLQKIEKIRISSWFS